MSTPTSVQITNVALHAGRHGSNMKTSSSSSSSSPSSASPSSASQVSSSNTSTSRVIYSATPPGPPTRTLTRNLRKLIAERARQAQTIASSQQTLVPPDPPLLQPTPIQPQSALPLSQSISDAQTPTQGVPMHQMHPMHQMYQMPQPQQPSNSAFGPYSQPSAPPPTSAPGIALPPRMAVPPNPSPPSAVSSGAMPLSGVPYYAPTPMPIWTGYQGYTSMAPPRLELSRFDGSTDLEVWLSEVSTCALAGGWTEATTFGQMLSHLRGRARLDYEAYADRIPDVATLRSHLVRAFLPEDRFYARLAELSCAPTNTRRLR